MIKRRVGQMAIANRLKKLEAMQENKEHIGVIVFSVDDDGRIWTANIKKERLFFETMVEVENYLIGVPGVTKNTLIIIDDTGVGENWLYLPCDPILYFCTSEGRKAFVEIWDSENWLALYISVIQEILTLTESMKDPNMRLPGFDDPALQDLIQNYNSMSIEQLVERYKDEKWFRGKDR